MRMCLATGAIVSTLGILIGAASSTNASTSTRPAPRLARTHAVRARFAATTCSTKGTGAFVGGNDGNVAGGSDSAVVGGNSNEACDAYSGIGAGSANDIGNNDYATSSFIFAGYENAIVGEESAVGAGVENAVDIDDAFVGAGESNTANGQNSVIAGGSENDTAGYADLAIVGGLNNYMSGETEYAFIGSGESNEAEGKYTFVGSGLGNQFGGFGSFVGAGGSIYETSGFANLGKLNNGASGNDSFIGAGDENSVAADQSFIGSGLLNSIGTNDTYSIITGGYGNVVKSAYGTIDGGESNTAGGNFATIPGGAHNKALGTLSFAAGYQAQANHSGSFVWSDDVSGASPLTDTNVDQFVVRAAGGTYVYSSENLASGVKLAAGSGTWSSLSDRNAKTAIVPVDDEAILAKVAALPVSTWRYKTEQSVRHVGPMAQDFYSAFGVGEDDLHISSIDEDGVALAAIKALCSQVGVLAARDAALEARDADLERRLDRLSGSSSTHAPQAR